MVKRALLTLIPTAVWMDGGHIPASTQGGIDHPQSSDESEIVEFEMLDRGRKLLRYLLPKLLAVPCLVLATPKRCVDVGLLSNG